MTTHRAPADPVGADLTRLLKALKLGALADTLPERAALARQHKLSHIGFLEVLLADEVSRRESRSAALRSAKAGLDPTMRFDTWTTMKDLRYDRTLLGDLTSLRFLDAGQSAIILGPVGVGKTHLATALGHMAIRRRNSVLFARSDKLFTRLRAARLDNTVDAEIRRLTTIDVLIIDDFALRPLGRNQRLLRNHRRTPPRQDHHRDLQPRTLRMVDHDRRHPAGPISDRPTHRHRPHPRHRRTVLPSTHPTWPT
jgi:DNA replication protein DnaC